MSQGDSVTMGEAEKSAVALHPHVDPVVVEMDLPGSLCNVWHALTTTDGAQAFLGCNVQIELCIGGPYEILFDASQPAGKRGSETCAILSFLPQRILSFTWNAPPQFTHARDRHTWVIIELEPVTANETSLRLTHLGWSEQISQHPDHREEWLAVRTYFANAWPRFFSALQRHLSDRN